MPRVLQPSKTAIQNGRAATMTISNFMDTVPQNSENSSDGTEDNGELRTGTDLNGGDDIRYSIEEYSESDQRDIVAILQPFVGRWSI